MTGFVGFSILYESIMKIYTKTGDQGTTSLFTGKRVSKSSMRVQAYGTMDELNSWLGLLRTSVLEKDIQKIITRIQNELFELSADLATPVKSAKGKRHKEVPRISKKQIGQLEKWIDQYQEELPPLKEFILPGGSLSSGYMHITRSVCRRAEREVVKLKLQEKVNPLVSIYLNRLSDLFFVLARIINKRHKVAEPHWKP